MNSFPSILRLIFYQELEELSKDYFYVIRDKFKLPLSLRWVEIRHDWKICGERGWEALGRIWRIVFPLEIWRYMQVCADACKLHVARPRSDPDSRKTRYCYAIRSRVTSFIWSGPHWRTRAGRSCFLIAIPSSPLKIRLARSLYKWTLSELKNGRISGQSNNVELSWMNNEENRLSLVSGNEKNFKILFSRNFYK